MNKIKELTEKLIHILAFLSILLIGADMFSVEIKFTFKLPQLLLMMLTGLLIITKKYKLRKDKLMIAFVVTSLISTLFALSLSLAIPYYIYILCNIITIYFCISSYVEQYGVKKIIELLRITFFTQLGILLFQYVLVVLFKYEIPFMPSYGEHFGVPRFRLWFYEPSYMATYVLVWLTLGLTMFFVYNKKDYLKDIIGATIILVLSTSTSGFVGIAASFGLVFLIWILKGWNRKKLIIPIILLGMLIGVRIIFPDMYELFIGRLFNSSLNDASGGRIDKWIVTFKVFLEQPFFGVGPGNYGFYFGESIEYVPSNVTLDLLATLGIFGMIFYAIHVKLGYDLYMIYKNGLLNKKNKEEFNLLVGLYLGLFIFVLILQVNQGYLRLYHWLILGMMYGGVNTYRIEV